jgi:hypothetical protein
VSAGTVTTRRRRPRSVTLVGSLLCSEAVLGLVIATIGVLNVLPPTDGLGNAQRAPIDPTQLELPILAGLGGIASLVAGLGVLRLRPWAWLLAMTIEAVSLALCLRWYAVGEPLYGPMGLSCLIVLILNQREVRQTFEERHGTPR